MASWVLLLRSDLLLPIDAPTQRAAERRASDLRDRLVALQEIQALSTWLDQRPQLGRDVFARGRSEPVGEPELGPIEIDMIAFLWACLAQFDDPADAADTRPTYRIPEARERILRLLAASDTPLTLDQLLPESGQEPAVSPPTKLRRRSAWTSTFVAGLELARQGELVFDQENLFDRIIAQRNTEGLTAR